MDERVRSAINFMRTNLHRKITPEEIARSVGLSPCRLRHVFKDETGKSLTGYRRELQLRRSKELLEKTFLSVKEVAANVGINWVNHFVRDFEKAYGTAPARHARKHRHTRNNP